ncbi:LysR family transcriptional regulator [Actibacterium atlanticum]|uniref:LysR family transcriptional regulator n=1 Tax=Actibacterium atlanticum TaxID=1461693 RepID=A0A058ZJI0_9RHOB|nr:LysR family transcriptional regulator [Actibacterium atlanticum]KCV80971.1 LysR family transcriptional regulator [Actibacterium atlanticum]
MARNLDMTALRSFVAVADSGGVTRAAGFLNLTQSAVSMQIKRLEEMLDTQLFDRSSRQITLTTAGEQLLGYARRMLQLNDEIYARLTAQEFEGDVVLGVPHDIVYPAIPQVLRMFAAEYPRVKVHLLSSFTSELKEQFAKGEVDVILTTEDDPDAGGETLIEAPLVWVGAPNGHAWKSRPLQLAYEYKCRFRVPVQRALDAAGLPWEMAVESSSSRTIEATVTADLAVHTVIEGAEPPHLERIQHHGALPDLPRLKINLYRSDVGKGEIVETLTQLLRQAYIQQQGAPRLASAS